MPLWACWHCWDLSIFVNVFFSICLVFVRIWWAFVRICQGIVRSCPKLSVCVGICGVLSGFGRICQVLMGCVGICWDAWQKKIICADLSGFVATTNCRTSKWCCFGDDCDWQAVTSMQAWPNDVVIQVVSWCRQSGMECEHARNRMECEEGKFLEHRDTNDSYKALNMAARGQTLFLLAFHAPLGWWKLVANFHLSESAKPFVGHVTTVLHLCFYFASNTLFEHWDTGLSFFFFWFRV